MTGPAPTKANRLAGFSDGSLLAVGDQAVAFWCKVVRTLLAFLGYHFWKWPCALYFRPSHFRIIEIIHGPKFGNPACCLPTRYLRIIYAIICIQKNGWKNENTHSNDDHDCICRMRKYRWHRHIQSECSMRSFMHCDLLRMRKYTDDVSNHAAAPMHWQPEVVREIVSCAMNKNPLPYRLFWQMHKLESNTCHLP